MTNLERANRNQQIVQVYQSGASLNAVARQFKLNTETVRYHLKIAGVPRRNRGGFTKPMSDDIRNQIVSMYEIGMSQQKIADQIQYSQSKVCHVLRTRGVSTSLNGKRNHQWIGGRIKDSGGYIKVYIDSLDGKDKQLARATLPGDGQYIHEHRLVMARYLGRPLRQDETVHHIDEDKTNNDLSNLQLRIGRHGKGGCYRCAKCHSIDLEPVALAEVV